jgi:hypothetical protein
MAIGLACVTIEVSTDYDPSADFTAYATFGWLSERPETTGDIRLDNPLLHARLRRAVEEEFASRGYEKSDRPDFRVGYHLSLEKRLDVTTVDRHYGYGRRWGPPHGETWATEYEQGTLVLDVVDARVESLVWRGWGSRPIEGRAASPEESQQAVREVVAAILAEFPP